MDCVFEAPCDPNPDRRYKMVLDYRDRKGRGITFVFSPDGPRWTQMPHNVLHRPRIDR